MRSTDPALARWRLAGKQCALAGAALAVSLLIWLHATGPGARAGYDFASYVTAARTVAVGGNPYARLIAEYATSHGQPHGVAANGYVYPPLLAVVLAVPLRLGLSATDLWVLWNLLVAAAVLWMGVELARVLAPNWRSGRGDVPAKEPPSIDASPRSSPTAKLGSSAFSEFLRALRQLRVLRVESPRSALRGEPSLAAALWFTALILLPAVATYDLWLGQADLLIAALAVGAEALRLRRHPAAPLALGAAIAIKPVLLPLLAVWLWRRDWRATLWGLLAAVTLLLAPFLVAGGATALHDYVAFLTRWNGFNGSAEYINQSIYGVLLRGVTANPYTVPLVVAPALVAPLRWGLVLAATGFWLWTVPRNPQPDRALAFGEYLLALPLLLLASPLSEDIHYCLLIPALVGLAWLAWSRGWWRRPAGWFLWGCFVLACVPRMQELIYPTHLLVLPGQDDPLSGPGVTLLRTSILCLLAAATLLAGSAALRRERALSQPNVAVADRPLLPQLAPLGASPSERAEPSR